MTRTPKERINYRPSKYLVASSAWNIAGLATLVIAPSRWPVIVGAIVANHLSLVGAGLAPRCGLLGPNIVRSETQAGGREVVLTFDDGPDPVVTPQVLDILDRAGAGASFFCVGARAAMLPDLVREIAARGRRVENHSLSHRNDFFFLGPRSLVREVAGAQEILTRLAPRAPNFFRAPAGIRSPLLEFVLRRCGLRLVSWTRRGFDTVARDPAHIVRRLTRDLRAGDILLLHDRPAIRGGASVVEVLPRLLDAIGAHGLVAAPLINESN